MLCRPAFFLVFLVSSTYAASTYNLPLLQETLEIIGGDLITTVTNMINGGEEKYDVEDEVEEKPLFNKEHDQLEAEDDDQRENTLSDSKTNESSGEKDTVLDHVETNTAAPSTEEVPDDIKDTDDDKDTDDTQEENGSDEDDSEGTDQTDDVSNKVEPTNQGQENTGQNEKGSDGNGVEDKNAEGEEEEDEAKVLAATFVNLAADKIKTKLKDFELIN